MFSCHIHQRKPPRRPIPERIARANATRSAVRSAVEQVFAGQKHRMGEAAQCCDDAKHLWNGRGGLVVRTMVIARVGIKMSLANLAYKFQSLAWPEGHTDRA